MHVMGSFVENARLQLFHLPTLSFRRELQPWQAEQGVLVNLSISCFQDA
jgi:hypothetical protein